MKKLTAVLFGVGTRGTTYADLMKKSPEKFDIVAVADLIPERRNGIKEQYGIKDENCCADYNEILSRPKMADFAIISTQDNLHTDPALKAIEKGYHLLLEKPVAQTPEECIAICKAAAKKGVKVLVCHVLRYTQFYGAIKKLLMEGTLGDVMSVLAVEGVGNEHMSSSFIRGDWKSEKESTPLLIAKTCHDLDIIQWLIGKKCEKVSSFGDLTYFKPENAPEGAPHRCFGTDCPVREHCPYDVSKVYLEKESCIYWRNAVARGYSQKYHATDDEVKEGLKNTNFGACVFHAGNDVVDHQIVNMQFEGGATASLTVNAFNKGGRFLRIFGTKGELIGNLGDSKVNVYLFDGRQNIELDMAAVDESIAGAHAGGDTGIVNEMYEYFTDSYTGFRAADIDISIRNHLIGYAAERSRHNDVVVSLKDYANEFDFEY